MATRDDLVRALGDDAAAGRQQQLAQRPHQAPGLIVQALPGSSMPRVTEGRDVRIELEQRLAVELL